MRRCFAAAAAAAAFVVAIGAPAFAGEMTVKGELIDQACYTKDAKNVGEAHQSCATTCAKKGSPVALLTSDGVYTITGDLTKDNNAQLVPHMSHIMEVTGDVTEKDGKKMIAATAIKMISKS